MNDNTQIQITGSFSYKMRDFIKTYFLINNLDPSYKRIHSIGKIILLIINIIYISMAIGYSAIFLLLKYLVNNLRIKDIVESDMFKANILIINLIIIVILFSIMTIISIFQPITRISIIYNFIKKRHIYENVYKIDINEERIYIYHPEEENNFEWEAINRIYEYNEGYLFISNENNVVLLIPKRAFQNNNKTIKNIKILFTEIKGKEIIQLS